MRSMTGFGQASGANARHRVTVMMRSVNHRYLEIKLRLAEDYRELEAQVRQRLTGELHRGRVDAVVEIRALEEREADVEVHRGVVRAAHKALHELVEEGLITQELTAGDLLRLPEAMSVNLVPDLWEEEDQALLLQVAGEALEQLVRAREREGQDLRAIFEERIGSLEGVVRRLGELREGASAEILEATRGRLDRLLAGEGLDETRLAQEAALLADRADVTEELDRLGSHTQHFREVMGRPGAIGRRLDFLSQEIFRELNTLGAKCRNSEMTRSVLDAKELAEQLREQVQNVE